jgi:hypothetical protein
MLYSRADKLYHDSFASSYEYGIILHAYPQNARIENRPVCSITYSPTGAGEISQSEKASYVQSSELADQVKKTKK